MKQHWNKKSNNWRNKNWKDKQLKQIGFGYKHIKQLNTKQKINRKVAARSWKWQGNTVERWGKGCGKVVGSNVFFVLFFTFGQFVYCVIFIVCIVCFHFVSIVLIGLFYCFSIMFYVCCVFVWVWFSFVCVCFHNLLNCFVNDKVPALFSVLFVSLCLIIAIFKVFFSFLYFSNGIRS